MNLIDYVVNSVWCVIRQSESVDFKDTSNIFVAWQSLVVDTAINFSDSLLNPYSDRFVYVGSTPIGRSSVSRLQEKLYDGLSTPGTAISSSKWPTPAVRPKSRPDTPRPTSRANFSIWRKSQPLGLQALLQ